jgi:hypothetical protein
LPIYLRVNHLVQLQFKDILILSIAQGAKSLKDGAALLSQTNCFGTGLFGPVKQLLSFLVKAFDLRIGRCQLTLTVDTEAPLTVREFRTKYTEKTSSRTVETGTYHKRTGL